MVQRDPASIESQQEAEDKLDRVLVALSVSLLAIVARRLGKLEDSSLADVYAAMNVDLAEIDSLISKAIKELDDTTKTIFRDVYKGNEAWAADYYKAAGLSKDAIANNQALKDILADGIDDALLDAKKFVNTSAMGIMVSNDEWLPIRDAYMQEVGNAAVQVMAGKETGAQAIQRATKNLSASGIRVKYPNQTRELYSAVRMNVMNAYRTAMVNMRLEMGREFGADGVEVSAHSPCAPDHQPYQGRRFSYQSWDMIQSHLDRPLVFGANCHHTAYPVIMGVANRSYSQSQLDAMKQSSNGMVTVRGLSGKDLTMSRYQASQYQRGIEASIRKMNTEAYLLDVQGKDNAAITGAVKSRMAQYRRISKEANLPVMIDRTKAYAL